MLVACYGYCMEMTLLVILMKYNRYTSHFIGLVHINDYRTCGLHTKLYDLHVTCVITRRLYHLHNCKLRDWYNDITYRSRLCFQTSIVSVWISFLHVSVDIVFLVSLQLMVLQLNFGCSFS